MELLITPDGCVRCLYDEAIDLAALGQLVIYRASHVEPDPSGGGGRGWRVDLSPVGGPELGPFARRSTALAAERAWLTEHLLARAGH